MLQWFIRFPDFVDLNENSLLFRKNSNHQSTFNTPVLINKNSEKSLCVQTCQTNVWKHKSDAFFDNTETFLSLSPPPLPFFIVNSVSITHHELMEIILTLITLITVKLLCRIVNASIGVFSLATHIWWLITSKKFFCKDHWFSYPLCQSTIPRYKICSNDKPFSPEQVSDDNKVTNKSGFITWETTFSADFCHWIGLFVSGKIVKIQENCMVVKYQRKRW